MRQKQRVFSFITLFLAINFLSNAGLEPNVSCKNYKRSGQYLERSQTILKNKSISTTIDNVTEKIVMEERYETYPVTECSSFEGTGRGDWKGFYNTDNKAQALAKAIKGVGPKTAKELVPYFEGRKKPRSWQAFSNIISRADKRIGHGLKHKVLVEYGTENRKNLGYYSDSYCTTSLEGRYYVVPVLKEHREFYRSVSKDFTIVLENSHLLENESESFKVCFDSYSISVDPSKSYNHYSVVSHDKYSDSERIVLRASRKAISPAQNSSTILSVGDNGNLQLTVFNNSFSQDKLINAQTRVKVTVYNDGCWLFCGGNQEIIEDVIYDLSTDESKTVIDTGIKAESGEDYFAKVAIQRSGTKYYSSSFTRMSKTNEIEVK